MPKYKYQFMSPSYREEIILDENGKKLGTIRVKPVSLSWKAANEQNFKTVPIDSFINWIGSKSSNAKLSKS